jgi:serine/threonine-protein kinase HipA
MKHCPINYSPINDNQYYSESGLKLLSPKLTNLEPLDYSAEQQREEALRRVGKMSIQGVQLKLSAKLKIKESKFVLVDQFGQYILKPQSSDYPELPQNEALTMTLASLINIQVPIHGLVYSKDDSMTYFVKRFDRKGHNQRIPLEDFSQLSGGTRETKYNSSMEKVANLTKRYCTFPKIEAMKLLRLTLFNFLIGNEDMHLKNFSLITIGKKTMLSPAYDLLNTTITQPNTKEEMALPLNGKKNNLTRKDLVDYFALKHLELNDKVVDTILAEIRTALPRWQLLISCSFLSEKMQQRYLAILNSRSNRLLK